MYQATPKHRRKSLRAPARQPIYAFDGYIKDIDGDEYAPEDEEDGGLLGWDSPERLRKTPGGPRNTPCAPCVEDMINQGPDSLCQDQASRNKGACFSCNLKRRKCSEVPLAATSAALNLQAASIQNKSRELGAEQWAILASKASHALEKPQSHYRREGPRIEATQGQSSSQSTAFVPAPNHQNETVAEAINRNSKLVERSSKQMQQLIELAERWLERDERSNEQKQRLIELAERSNDLLMHLLAELTSLPETP
ncbi:hypothetical protein QQZ08_010539 [Neonectria magnoliae]|uniref:Zn(2)-C6 fungal-type domain-containing protein n=1 Tax=Neonectria magnoliae TaxID=2732573 RepID=A0ABR1HHF2_9HYPO